MSAVLAWGSTTLLASAALMLLVLAVRVPVRHWVGPRVGYALWALPVARMLLPPLAGTLGPFPLSGQLAAKASVLFVGPTLGAAGIGRAQAPWLGSTFAAIWLAGAVTVLAVYAVRHRQYCRRLRMQGTALGRIGPVRILAADVAGPLSFGIVRRFIAVPLDFARDYASHERELALAHESAHHARGDLIANWVSLVVLAAHWWNPVAWVAIRAFREDQEMAADADVLADRGPGMRALYGHVLAKAAGVGAPPMCNLGARSSLKGRLMIIRQAPRSRGTRLIGGAILALSASVALAATAATSVGTAGTKVRQAVTIGVKPDGRGSYSLILGDTAVAHGADLPHHLVLPADFSPAGGCGLTSTAKPFAMVIKGTGATQTYTVMCGSAVPAPVHATLAEGLTSLKVMRASVVSQPASASFPEPERARALHAIDRSIGEVEATLAVAG